MVNKLEEFGDYLKRLRVDYGLTLSGLAEESGYSTAYLSQIEKGRRKKRATIDVLKRLSLALEVPYSELLREAGYEELAEGQYYKEIFSRTKGVRKIRTLENDEGFKNTENLINMNVNAISKWAQDPRFNKNETKILIEHLSELLLKYQEVIKKMVSTKQKWNTSKDYLKMLWSEEITEEDIKRVFLEIELESNVKNLTKWIDSLPEFIALNKMEI